MPRCSAAEGGAMKELVFVNGTMGVGKSTVCAELLPLLAPAAFLDGDWCWNMSPFVVNEETRAMVLDNAAHVLNSFLHCSVYRFVLFCWVMHSRDIVDEVLDRLDLAGVRFTLVTLTCSRQALEARLQSDISRKRRSPGVLSRSLERLPLYADMGGVVVDTSAVTAEEAARRIARMFIKV